ncbi:MAG TPA: helix-turn-helix transcriptional regulator [Planctomycetota bacterium]|nr:helix-turn-helix transcriptional regulator [Planctomycetota bacterium]
MSHFGDLVSTLRKERGWTLAIVAKKLRSSKGYISGIEGGKVNPPSVKMIDKYARVFCEDAKRFLRIAWVDKAPRLIRADAERFLALHEPGLFRDSPPPMMRT